jgi:hypothetical protein
MATGQKGVCVKERWLILHMPRHLFQKSNYVWHSSVVFFIWWQRNGSNMSEFGRLFDPLACLLLV